MGAARTVASPSTVRIRAGQVLEPTWSRRGDRERSRSPVVAAAIGMFVGPVGLDALTSKFRRASVYAVDGTGHEGLVGR